MGVQRRMFPSLRQEEHLGPPVPRQSVLNTTEEVSRDRDVWLPNIAFKEEVCFLQAAFWDGSELAN